MPWSIVLVLLMLLLLLMMMVVIMVMVMAMIMLQMQAQYEVKEWRFELVADTLIEAFICSSPPSDRDKTVLPHIRGSANGRLETEGATVAAVRCSSSVARKLEK